MHFFSRHETFLTILTIITFNFQFVNAYIQCDFYFVYKITKDYNILQGKLFKKIYTSIIKGSESYTSLLEIEMPTN